MQSAISATVLGFALYQFAVSPTSSDKPIYASWVGLVVGYWLPSPNSRKDNDDPSNTTTLTHTQTLIKQQDVSLQSQSEHDDG